MRDQVVRLNRMAMGILGKIFTWWDGATIGTLLYSKRKGIAFGSDDAGNHYFHSRDGTRRWVIYAGANDASRVPPEWHGWLHHTHDGEPESYLPPIRKWESAPTGNLTGSNQAYLPDGAIAKGGKRAAAAGDYRPWKPEN